MGLYDRDWFWEDADRRYNDSPTPKKKSKPHQQSNTSKNEPQKIHFSEKDYNVLYPSDSESQVIIEIVGELIGIL